MQILSTSLLSICFTGNGRERNVCLQPFLYPRTMQITYTEQLDLQHLFGAISEVDHRSLRNQNFWHIPLWKEINSWKCKSFSLQAISSSCHSFPIPSSNSSLCCNVTLLPLISLPWSQICQLFMCRAMGISSVHNPYAKSVVSSMLDSAKTPEIILVRGQFWGTEISQGESYKKENSSTNSSGTSTPLWNSKIKYTLSSPTCQQSALAMMLSKFVEESEKGLFLTDTFELGINN